MSKKRGLPIERAYKKGLWLEYFTVGYNIVEAAVSIIFGSLAQSIALVGFGLDSVVESLSGGVMIWRLRQHGRISQEEEEKIERRAMRLVAITFFVLGLYVLFQALKKWLGKEVPSPSLPGIIIAMVSIVVMPLLTWQKYKTGVQIRSKALIADSKETLACAFLSIALLIGLGFNYLFSIWQADPAVGLIIVIYLFREGLKSWKEARE